MDKIEFKKLLFKVAFCTMACDGHIDEREIEEMKAMDKDTSYFGGVDLSEELSKLVGAFSIKGAKVIEELFVTLRENKLNPIQELLILEVAIRIINSDSKHDDNELRFLHLLRGRLDLHNETIRDRFGEISLLNFNEEDGVGVFKSSETEFTRNMPLPEFADLSSVLLDLGGKN